MNGARPSTRVYRIALTLAATLLGSRFATAAGNPLNSSDDTSKKSVTEGDARAHTDFNLLPVVGGSTDIGVVVGAFSNWARLKKTYEPYLWNVEAAAALSFKAGDGLEMPYQDVYAKLTVPRLFDTKVRLEIRPSYTRETTLGYYGIGNASSDVGPPGASAKYFQYDRLHPALDLLLRWPFFDHAGGRVGFRYTENRIRVESGSKLDEDLRTGSPEVQKLLGSVAPHAVALFTYGLQWDDRDSEVSSHRGQFHQLDFKVSPGGAGAFPYRYGQLSFDGRIFVPLAMPEITLATRLVADMLFGDPPFYELARFDDTYAVGGSNGVRGVPGQRYHGRRKVVANLELRTELFHFRAFSKALSLGPVAFFDAGRVWADIDWQPDLDGTGVGLKYGTGAGLRLQSGETFVVRVDVAWSPDAKPLGGYFAVGQMF